MSTQSINLSKLNAEIVARNARFTKATPAQRRVLIAQDVIDQLAARRMSACTGNWVESHEKHDLIVPLAGSAQEAILSNQVSCNVCALGSIMVSLILFKNRVETAALDGLDPRESDEVAAVFPRNQIRLIEMAFEQGEGAYDPETMDDYMAIAFGKQYSDDDERLVAIMTNIVKNRGVFKLNVSENDRRKAMGEYVYDQLDLNGREVTEAALRFIPLAKRDAFVKALQNV